MSQNNMNFIHVWADGCCEYNPGGRCGIGIVLLYKNHKKEISEAIGKGTNNIAELFAIKRALETIKKRNLPTIIYSDSSYVIGVLQKGWKAKANKELIEEIKKLIKEYKEIKIIKVRGHSSNKYNNRADNLAKKALL